MKTWVRTTLGVCLLSVGAVGAWGQTCGEWTLTDNPTFEGAETFPLYIVPFAPDSAIGVRTASVNGEPRLLRMNWDGVAWSVIAADALGFSTGWDGRALYANAPDDLWVAGLLAVDNFHGLPFLAHFDGQDWEVHDGLLFEDPNPQGGDPIRTAEGGEIVYLADDDIWVLGAGESPEKTVSCPVASHWDGSNLEESTPQIQPVFNRTNFFQAGAGVATDDVWVVGYGRDVARTFQVLTYHWDGSSWTPYTSWTELPGSDSLQDLLHDVVALGPNDVWAVGKKLILQDGSSHTASLYLHWDGSGWREVAGPDIGPLTSVAAVNATDIWATNPYGEYGGRLAHWDGTGWTEVNSAPIPTATHIGLSNLAADAAGDVWAIGYWGIYDGQGGWDVYRNIIERLSPACAGDLDGDGDVDLTDVAMLLADFDCASGDCSGDVDGDGATTLTDLAILLANFG